MQTILSGIRPTGRLHIGNYFGALKNFLELQKKHRCYFFIADLHSLNEPYNPSQKYAQILDLAADFLAAGLNPQKTTLFIQSRVHEHSELAVLLANVVPVSYLFRMTQYKEKSAGKNQKKINAGLLYYPVLMAADILLYNPHLVPVGADQTQHVEYARITARFFNNTFGHCFQEPQALYTETPKIMSIADPLKKMSASAGEKHCIFLDDDQKTISQKLASAPTDAGDGKSLGAENLFLLLKLFSSRETYEAFLHQKKSRKIRYAELKSILARDIAQYFNTFRKKKKQLLRNPKTIEEIFINGSKKAQEQAQQTLKRVKKKMGLIP